MFSPNSSDGPSIAFVTIVCSWIFAAVAVVAVGLLVWSRRIMGLQLLIDDCIMLVALTIALALVAQTTWAVVDEGLDKRLEEVPMRQRAVIVRARRSPAKLDSYCADTCP